MNAIKGFGIALLIIVVVFFVGTGIHSCNKDMKHMNELVSAEASIVSLRVGDSIPEGSFFLGSGTIRGQSYFITYIRVESGYRYVRLKTDETTIYESDLELPGVKWKMRRHLAGENLSELYHARRIQMWAEDIELTVPVGTIVKEFKLE